MKNEKSIWIASIDPKKLDLINKIKKTDIYELPFKHNILIDDIIYLYLTSPVKKILCRTTVVRKNLSRRTLLLKTQEVFPLDSTELSFERLTKNGLNGPIRSVINLNKNNDLLNYIQSVERKLNFINMPVLNKKITVDRKKIAFIVFLSLGAGTMGLLTYFILKKLYSRD
ncbi:MAG: hypothetical protein APR63_12925 [Desulfuromonas sp. SDB]|nr:MAG: hypothetical protein APR63_12925 [Desulfuromonas sp. SDB]